MNKSGRNHHAAVLSSKFFTFPFKRISLFWLAGIASIFFQSIFASDWPQLLGPTGDAVYAGPALAESWPDKGPPVLWSAQIGQGYSSPVVGENRLIICHRLDQNLVVDCLDPKTGHNFWSYKHPMKFQDGAYFDS